MVHSDYQQAYEQAVQNDPRVEELVRLNGRIEWADEDAPDGVLDAFREADVLIEQATAKRGEWLFRLRADNQEALSAFQQACFEAGVQLDIRRVHHNPAPADSPTFGITDKQGEALELAFTEG